jgi:hypothetical protein
MDIEKRSEGKAVLSFKYFAYETKQGNFSLELSIEGSTARFKGPLDIFLSEGGS